jgi:hypothetical protein
MKCGPGIGYTPICSTSSLAGEQEKKACGTFVCEKDSPGFDLPVFPYFLPVLFQDLSPFDVHLWR